MENDPTGSSANALEMVLYVNPATGISAKARRNLDAALKGCDPSTYRLTVRDVSQDLAGIEQVVRIENPLHFAKHIVERPKLLAKEPSAAESAAFWAVRRSRKTLPPSTARATMPTSPTRASAMMIRA